MKENKNKIFGILLIGIIVLLISIGNILSYQSSSYGRYGVSSVTYLGGQGIDIYPTLDQEKCGAGQDLLLQISPIGCSPSVVRSDLLEEQNVAVFCPIMATKINPLIDINTINYMTLQKSSDISKEVQGVGFHPAQSAIASSDTFLDSSVLENIGYAVIVLEKQKSEADMPDYVSGTIKANIKYDIENAFGTGKSIYYLPVLSDDEWEDSYKQYSFWKGKGYLRAESIEENDATISVYQDQTKKFRTLNLEDGEVSGDVFIPGYYCAARLNLKLEDVDAPETFAKITVNDEYYELKEGEDFLDNKCEIKKIENVGLLERANIKCEDDDDSKAFTLINSPTIKLNIDGREKDYQIGDLLYTAEDDPNKNVYLAGAYTKLNSGQTKDLEIFLFKAPIHEDKLTYDQLKDMKSLFDNYRTEKGKGTGIKVVDLAGLIIKRYSENFKEIYKWTIDGKTIEYLEFGEGKDYSGKSVSVVGFGDAEDVEISNEFKESFDTAIKEYRKLGQQFSNEQISDSNDLSEFETYAEKGLWEAQELAEKTMQYRTRIELLNEFIERYPDSKKINEAKEIIEQSENSNSEINSIDISINGKIKTIFFNGIYEPSFEDYGATVKINDEFYNLRKNEKLYIPDTDEYIELLEINEESAKISFAGINAPSDLKTGADIKLNDYEVVGANQYKIEISNINLKSVAKISLNPSLVYEGTETNFTFKIGIEKRAIQLSPDKIQDKIDNLETQLNKWNSISEKLNQATETFKGACYATGAYFTVKNFFSNAKGKSIARQTVMRGDGGWTDKCSKLVSENKYSTMDSCYYENADAIDRDVDKLNNIIQSQNQEIKDIQDEFKKSNILGETSIDEEKFAKTYIPEVAKDLNKITSVSDGTNTINIKDIIGTITGEGWGNGTLDTEQARDVQLYSQILSDSSSSTELKAIAEKELYSTLKDIQTTSKNFVIANNLANELKINVDKITFLQIGKDAKKLTYEDLTLGDVANDVFSGATMVNLADYGLDENTPISIIQTSTGDKYLLILDDSAGTDKLPIMKEENDLFIFDLNGNFISDPSDELRNIYFQKYDSTSYKNPYLNPEIKYFESGNYKGYPAIVPFDTKNGWYAATKQSISSITSYDSSARVTFFYLCNVGKNGREEFNSGMGDDICESVNTGSGSVYNQFSGLEQDETTSLINKAVNAIEKAQRAYRSGVKEVNGIKVGEPATNIPEMQCQDFMSPKECYILFNACDPVICPSSRCNLGGAYTVSDVIQSGIIGSIALCLPNYREKIIVPVCLSGINAGVEGLVSMMDSYQSCLQESLDTGQQVGICDQVHSIYLCEFFWRQAAPLSNQLIPKILSLAAGQGIRGGGEYLSINSAWETAQNSVDYFKEYYGANAYKAFQIRSSTDVGSAVCKNFVSLSVGSSNFIDNLLEPDSPVQYSAWFSEIPFTTATNPPTSQYKVYYHIYAGTDSGSYYRVYLKSPSGSSYYQDAPTILVANGYLGEGETADETRDFTATAGYQELCISVNNQEECGFKEVSTSFASDYVTDTYVQEEVNNTNIKTEEECISGSSTLYSLINPNLEEGADDYLNPDISKLGIVRICATENPGKGTDANAGTKEGRWQQVGYCDDKNIKCWIDTESVEDAIEISSVEDQTLSELASSSLDALKKEGGYLTDSEYNLQISSLKETVGKNVNEGIIDSTKLKEEIIKIDEIFDKVLFSNQKAELLGFRARAYNKLANNVAWVDIITKILSLTIPEEEEEETVGEETTEPSKTTTVTGASLNQYQIEIGEKLIKIAQEIKEDENINDALVKEDTGASNFECLVLMLVYQESYFYHCKSAAEIDEDVLYCNDNLEKVFKNKDEKSYGIMQINLNAHPNMAEDVANFEKNAEYGINYLISKYNTDSKFYACKNIDYAGWQRALRYYNGWNTNCSKGNINYVEDVLSHAATIGKNFPEVCGDMKEIGETTSTTDSTDSTSTTETGKISNAELISKIELKQIVQFGFDKTFDYLTLPIPDQMGLMVYRGDLENPDNSLKSIKYTITLKKNQNTIKIGEFSSNSYSTFVSLKDNLKKIDYLKDAKIGDSYYYEITAERGNLIDVETGEIKIGLLTSDKTQEDIIKSVNFYQVINGGIDKKLNTILVGETISLRITRGAFTRLENPGSKLIYSILLKNQNGETVLYEEKESSKLNINFELGSELFKNSISGDKFTYEVTSVLDDSFDVETGVIRIEIGSCEDCGKGLFNICDKEECLAIEEQLGIPCEFSGAADGSSGFCTEGDWAQFEQG